MCSNSRSSGKTILRKSATAVFPVTFIYDGHGRSTVLDFGGGYSFRRISDALIGVAPDHLRRQPPILILSACKSHTLARKLLTEMKVRDGGPYHLPILITPEEFGQDVVKNIYQESFFRNDLRISAREEVRLSFLFRNARINASVYVPDVGNVAVQIS